MPASNASDDAEMSMMDDASSSSVSLTDTPAETQATIPFENPTTPIHAQPLHYPSEPTPPHTGPEPRLPSLNANGKRALPGSGIDLPSQPMQDALGSTINARGGNAMASGSGSRWDLNEDEALGEVDEDAAAAKETAEPGAAWRSRKGQEEMRKAMEQIVDREYMIKKKYGDVLLDPRRQARTAAEAGPS